MTQKSIFFTGFVAQASRLRAGGPLQRGGSRSHKKPLLNLTHFIFAGG